MRHAGFGGEEIDTFREALSKITRHAISGCESDLSKLSELQRRFEKIQAASVSPLERVYLLLDDTRRFGTLVFSHLARSGFVAVSLLRSLCTVGCTTIDQTEAFLASVRTVSSDIQSDSKRVAKGEMAWEDFVKSYGHLRPGTYDITSPHYASAPEKFLRPMVENALDSGKQEQTEPWDSDTRKAIAAQLDKLELSVSVDAFERFLRQAIEGREFSKFVFTRNLSAALEALAEFGRAHSISREQLAHIRIQDFLELRSARPEKMAELLDKLSNEGKDAYAVTQLMCLPSQIFSEADFYCFEQPKAEPNFVTRKCVRAPIVPLSARISPDIDLSKKIVLIPNADPGFDWLFARSLAGLITMYGGLNSHMAIRAAEFQLPAAIGIGELTYETVSKAEAIELDCSSRQIRVIR